MNVQRTQVTHQPPTHMISSVSPLKAQAAHEDSSCAKSLEMGSTSAVSGKDVLISRGSAKKGGLRPCPNPEAPTMSQNSARGSHPTFKLRDRAKI